MKREDIIRMAREAGFERIVGVYKDGTRIVEVPNPELLERFAALVAAAEREACAQLCADYTAWGREWGQDNNHMAAEAATNECAAAIRARNNT